MIEKGSDLGGAAIADAKGGDLVSTAVKTGARYADVAVMAS